MTTASKSKAPAAAESWGQWLEQVDQLQAERAEITGIEDARKQLEGAQRRVQYLCGQAWNSAHMPGDLSGSALRGDEAAQNVRAVVRGEASDPGDPLAAAAHLRDLISRARRSMDWGNQPEDRRAFLVDLAGNLSDAAVTLERARDEVAELEEARAEVDQRLEDLEEKAPKASASSLEALRKECEAAAGERDRIAAALKNLTADDSPLALARESEQAAQERLDEAEALLAIGEAKPDEVKAAQAEAKKAATALEARREEHRSQEAARRGMTRKLEEAESRLETLTRAHRQAVTRVRSADLAAREAALVEHAKAFQEHLADLARIHADLEEAQPGSIYGPARLEVKMPTLHHHPEGDMINAHGLEVTAAGEEA